MNTASSSAERTSHSRRRLRTALLMGGTIAITALIVGTVLTVGWTRSDASTRDTISQPFSTIRVSSDATELTVRYAEVDATQVIFHQGNRIWKASLRHDVSGGVLTVAETGNSLTPFGWIPTDPTTLEIVLPKSEEATPPAVDTTTQSGDVHISGRFADVAVNSAAGNITLEGGADSLTVSAQSGNVSVENYLLHGPLTGTTAAGNSDYSFRNLPSHAVLISRAGNITFTVPHGSYLINCRSEAGTVHQTAPSTLGSERVYQLKATAGDITVANR